MSEVNENEKLEIKVILIGNSGVGKTKLMNTSVGLDFHNYDNTTVSGSFVTKQLKINDKEYIINIWDTAGQELYRGVTQLFFRGSDIIILVYDISSLESFNGLENWYKICENIIDNEHIYGIVGNKCDLYLNSVVSENEAKEYAKSKKAKFKLVSAKDNPKGFVDFIKDLVIHYSKCTKTHRSESIKIERKKDNKNKDTCCK